VSDERFEVPLSTDRSRVLIFPVKLMTVVSDVSPTMNSVFRLEHPVKFTDVRATL
jgi:hypothetical protein